MVLAQRQNTSLLPLRCRKVLDEQKAPSAEQLRALWDSLQTVEAGEAVALAHDGQPLLVGADIVTAGIAVLLTFNRDWLQEDPARMTWCRQTLQLILDNPPKPIPFDTEEAVGNDRWDAFAAECGALLLAEDTEDVLARRLVAISVMAFHYKTCDITLIRAVKRRERLGPEFDRMLALAVRWAGLRATLLNARISVADKDNPVLGEERERRLKEMAYLGEHFVERRMPIEFPGLAEVNAYALSGRDALYSKLFPNYAEALARRRHGTEPQDVGLDANVIMAAFSWLDIGIARSAEEREHWLQFVRELLTGLIERLPVIDNPRKQEIGSLPTDFDGWVYKIVAKTIPLMTATERPKSLWQPILNLGAPAHRWVERFFWYWFTDGSQSSGSSSDFVQIWREMILYALGHPSWNPETNAHHYLEDMVVELLGFDQRWTRLGLNGEAAVAVGTLTDVLERAAQQWFGMEGVTRGFLHFAVEPGAARVLTAGVLWVAKAVDLFRSNYWRAGLEDSLVSFLDVCWQRERLQIRSDAALREAFLGLLSTLVSRGGHSAIALRDRVLASLNA